MKKILIIDAEIDCLNTLSASLQAAGYEVMTATHASDALGISAQANLIILAVELPDQNGFIVCSQLKRNPETAGIPVFITSSADSTAAFEQHLNLANHADGYFLKPLDIPVLLEEMQATFDDLEAMEAEMAASNSAAETAVPEAAAPVSEEMIDVSAPSEDGVPGEDSEIIKALSVDDLNLFSEIDSNELVDVEGDSFDDQNEEFSVVPEQPSVVPNIAPAVPAAPAAPPIPGKLPKPPKFGSISRPVPTTLPPPKPSKPAIPPVASIPTPPRPGAPSSVLPKAPLGGAHFGDSKSISSTFSSVSQTAIPAADLARLTDEITVLKNEITALKSEITARDNRITVLQSQCDALSSRCQNAEAISEALKAETEAALEQKNNSEHFAESSMAIKMELESSLVNAQNEITALNERLAQSAELARQLLALVQIN